MIQIYSGNGRGKSSCAFGLAIRAAMANKKVFIGQFVKDMKYNETKIENHLENIDIKQFGNGCFITRKPNKDDKIKALKGLEYIEKNIELYDVFILDEITIALNYELISNNKLIKFLKKYKDNKEFIITGRDCPKEIYKHADLITEMKEIKHYFAQQNITSRDGFDK
ncbi:MAG: cob(I)yrinic acid a,c-diamide adenosyltransferase [Bacillota bacterium]